MSLYAELLFPAPFSVLIVEKVGVRKTVLICSVLSTLGLALTGYANLSWQATLSYSVLAGMVFSILV